MTAVLVVALPFSGHVDPVLPVARALARRGHRVRVVTGRRFRQPVLDLGAEWLPLPAASDLDERTLHTDRPERAALRGPALARFDMLAFLQPLREQYAVLRAALAAEPADVVLSDPFHFGTIPLLCSPDRPAVAVSGIMPLSLPRAGLGPLGIGPALPAPLAPGRDALVRLGLRLLLGPAQTFAAHQVAAEGARLRHHFLEWALGADAVVQFCSPSFEPAVTGLAPQVSFVGPTSPSRGATTGPADGGAPSLPSWWQRLDERPVVHVTQGTIANHDLGQLVAPTIRGLADRPVQVIATVAGADRSALPQPLPGNARVEDHLPYDALLPRCAVHVTNGGYGGVQLALRHAVPVVTAGTTEDKRAVAQRVRLSGAGLTLRTSAPSPGQVEHAVGRVLSEPAFRRRAAFLAAEIAACGGADAAADALISLARRT